MKTKVILIFFILVCIGIMIAGCSSPSTSSQVNTQSSSNLDPIVGCWVNNYAEPSGLMNTERKIVLDSSGSGYLQVTVTNTQGIKPSSMRDLVNWAKISDTKYSVIDHSKYGKDIYLTFGLSNGILTMGEGGIVYHKTTC